MQFLVFGEVDETAHMGFFKKFSIFYCGCSCVW